MNRYKVYVDIADYKNKYIVVKSIDVDSAKERASAVLFEIHNENGKLMSQEGDEIVVEQDRKKDTHNDTELLQM